MEADLDRIVSESEVPVLVDFYADWCGPCKVMAPLFDTLARERRGEVLVTKLDTDRNPEATRRFNVRGIPTTIVFIGGREVARETGAIPRPRLQALLDLAVAEQKA
jgi:thioredoxin 2